MSMWHKPEGMVFETPPRYNTWNVEYHAHGAGQMQQLRSLHVYFAATTMKITEEWVTDKDFQQEKEVNKYIARQAKATQAKERLAKAKADATTAIAKAMAIKKPAMAIKKPKIRRKKPAAKKKPASMR